MKRSVILVSFVSGLLFSSLAYSYTYQGDIFLDGNGGGAVGVVTTTAADNSSNSKNQSSNKNTKVVKKAKDNSSSQEKNDEALKRAMRITEMHDPSAPNYRGVRR